VSLPPESTVSSFDAPPIPEALLSPLLDTAADSLSSFDAELPAVLRPLAGFDRRGLSHGPARQQLQRAIEIDPAFRDFVSDSFIGREAVARVIDAWDLDAAAEIIDDAMARSDLALLASALYAVRPNGWEFGLGMIVARAGQVRSDEERADDTKAHQTEVAALAEARRRAEGARVSAENKIKSLEDELKEERRARRERELVADRSAAEAAKKIKAAEATEAAAALAIKKAESLTEREADRARNAELALRDLRRVTGAAATPPTAGLSSENAHVLAEAANTARRLATRLEGLTTATQVELRATAALAAEESGDVVNRRSQPVCPPGLTSDSAAALDAMLRTRGVCLVVDGYNISMNAWFDASIADQRARLLVALERLHQRLRCDVVVVFDGSDAAATIPPKRSGVRVLFSTGGEKADPVIVREVGKMGVNIPIIVASSDRWVAEHSEDLGAIAVPAASLVEVIRH